MYQFVPPLTDEGILDRRPRTLFECLVDGKLDMHRVLQYNMRSYNESQKRCFELLFSASLLHEEEEEDEEADDSTQFTSPPAPKKRRTEKQVVIDTVRVTSERHCQSPVMPQWYNMYVQLPDLDDSTLHRSIRRRFRLPCNSFKEMAALASDSTIFQHWKEGNCDGIHQKSTPLPLLILRALQYLGRGWAFSDLAEDTGIEMEIRSFMHNFIIFGSTELCNKFDVAPTIAEGVIHHTEEYINCGFPLFSTQGGFPAPMNMQVGFPAPMNMQGGFPVPMNKKGFFPDFNMQGFFPDFNMQGGFPVFNMQAPERVTNN